MGVTLHLVQGVRYDMRGNGAFWLVGWPANSVPKGYFHGRRETTFYSSDLTDGTYNSQDILCQDRDL